MTTTDPVKADNEVNYFSIPGAPGEYFVCPRYHGKATLSVTSCAAQWQRAKSGGEEARIRLHACVNCPIGARHAGVEDFKPKSEIQTSKVCVRCHRPAARIIHKRLCVSCVNRQYEIEKGRNARGNKPTQCPELKNIAVLVRNDDKPAKPLEFIAENTLEAVLSAIKTSNGQVIVGFRGPPPRPAVTQYNLF